MCDAAPRQIHFPPRINQARDRRLIAAHLASLEGDLIVEPTAKQHGNPTTKDTKCTKENRGLMTTFKTFPARSSVLISFETSRSLRRSSCPSWFNTPHLVKYTSPHASTKLVIGV